MQLAGSDWMMCITLALLAAFVITTLGYPKAETGAEIHAQEEAEAPGCSLPEFLKKYKWYSISLLGILLIAMFHAMSENYFIEVFRRLGGDSGNVGTALFIATMTAVPVLFYFDRIHKRLSSRRILLISGVMFTLKAVLLLLAPSVLCIYLIQLLQMVTYAFISPVQMYYAREQVQPCDMVKGQAFATASYALGCALGNLTGGFLVGYFSVVTMLSAGIVMAAAGTAVLFISLRKV